MQPNKSPKLGSCMSSSSASACFNFLRHSSRVFLAGVVYHPCDDAVVRDIEGAALLGLHDGAHGLNGQDGAFHHKRPIAQKPHVVAGGKGRGGVLQNSNEPNICRVRRNEAMHLWVLLLKRGLKWRASKQMSEALYQNEVNQQASGLKSGCVAPYQGDCGSNVPQDGLRGQANDHRGTAQRSHERGDINSKRGNDGKAGADVDAVVHEAGNGLEQPVGSGLGAFSAQERILDVSNYDVLKADGSPGCTNDDNYLREILHHLGHHFQRVHHFLALANCKESKGGGMRKQLFGQCLLLDVSCLRGL